MSKTIAEALYEQGEARGIEQGIEKGQLALAREMLLRLLEQKFGPLPKAVLRRVTATTDVERLKGCTYGVLQMASLKDLNL